MKANTRLFGEIDIEEEKIITLENGMIGFPELQKFTLIYDSESDGKASSIMWLQSMDDGDIAFPVIEPYIIKPDYAPELNDELLSVFGEIKKDNIYVLSTITVPKDIKNMAMNLKAPIVVNMDTNRGGQIIVENDYPVKYKFYNRLKEMAGE